MAMGRLNGKGFISKPDVVFLDKEQRIWMAYDLGEWGGNGCFFDLRLKEFYCDESLTSLYHDKYGWENVKNPPFELLQKEFPDKIKITDTDTLYKFPHNLYLSNTKGIAEDDKGNFYITSSMMHFFLEGDISKVIKSNYKDYYKNIYLDNILKHTVKTDSTDGKIYKLKSIEEYLGPIAFNKYDKHMYYYTNEGFFKIIEQENTYGKQFLFRPYIKWKFGMAHSVGYQMNVTKFEFIEPKTLVFLTSGNGVGIYKDSKITYYK